jgi:hypothetical protein
MNGWSDFIGGLANNLVGCKPPAEWIWDVATPAFEVNATVIFLRLPKPNPTG